MTSPVLTPVGKINIPPLKQKETKITSLVEPKQIQNTAVVYKSSLQILFSKVLDWIKSKL